MISGERIKELRNAQGLTQKELGRKIGISQQAVNLIEHDKRRINIDLYAKICEILDPSQSELVRIPGTAFYRDDYDLERTSEQEELYFINKTAGFIHQLNRKGQEKAIEQIELLTKIPEYQKEEIK